MLRDRTEAFDLLKSMGAPGRLILHAQLVSEAADQLLIEFSAIGIELDEVVVKLGAVLHDTGKISHPNELTEPGSEHERAGQAILLACGVQAQIARVCVTHASWNAPDASLEERIIALADKLWKGKREPELELSIIDTVAGLLACSRWDVFERLDTAFEEIAADGLKRLQQSRSN